MINGIKVADMDTHVDPSLVVLEKYVEPQLQTPPAGVGTLQAGAPEHPQGTQPGDGGRGAP